MVLLSGTARLLALTFLVSTMLLIGMRAGVTGLRALRAARSLALRTILANLVVAPLLGFACIRLLPVPRESAAAIVLLACLPGGLAAVQFTSKVKGQGALPGAMLVVLNILALLISPVILRILLPAGESLAIPYGRALLFLGLTILIPLAVGMLLCDQAPRATAILARPLAVLGMLAFVAFTLVTKSFRKEAVSGIGAAAAIAMLLFILTTMAAGWLLGGPARETRQLLATATSMRNPALCLAIAKCTPAGTAVIPALVAFSLLMVPPNMLFTVCNGIRSRRAAARSKEARKGEPS